MWKSCIFPCHCSFRALQNRAGGSAAAAMVTHAVRGVPASGYKHDQHGSTRHFGRHLARLRASSSEGPPLDVVLQWADCVGPSRVLSPGAQTLMGPLRRFQGNEHTRRLCGSRGGLPVRGGQKFIRWQCLCHPPLRLSTPYIQPNVNYVMCKFYNRSPGSYYLYRSRT